jgi:hypothetical protein
MPKIQFPRKSQKKGFHIILHGGPVIYTDKKDTFIVPESSIRLLEKAKIKFKKIPRLKI